jgi:HD-GYP domain-containing protein (c-di-GMP phosphodiesterase class II)
MIDSLLLLAAVLGIILAQAIFHFVKIAMQRRKLQEALSKVADVIDLKDVPTETRDIRNSVSTIAVRIARAMRLPNSEVLRIRLAAMVHDIGKIGVSRRILMKPGPLDAAEWSEMRRHPVIGADVLQPVELLSGVARIVRHHHEHYDGSGYPDGLKGDEIPLASRIILVADAFNMITSDVPWRRARSKSEALRELKEHAGGQFDPNVVRVFESMIDVV